MILWGSPSGCAGLSGRLCAYGERAGGPRADNSPLRRLATGAQLAKLPHKLR